MMKKLNESTIIVVVALLVVLGALGFVKAFDGSSTYVIENIEQANFNMEEASLGDFSDDISFGASGTRFPNGISADSTSPSAGEVRGTTLTMTGAATISGTSTISTMDASFQTDITFTTATSEGGGVGNPHSEILLANVENTGADQICSKRGTKVSIDTASTEIGWNNFYVGTSTTATTTDSTASAGLITASNVATSSTDILNGADDAGGFNGEYWVFNNSDHVVVWATFDHTGDAASSTDFTSAGGQRQEGKLHLDCRTRY
jgi:hypothetical protein